MRDSYSINNFHLVFYNKHFNCRMPLTANEFESHGNTLHSRQCGEVNSIHCRDIILLWGTLFVKSSVSGRQSERGAASLGREVRRGRGACLSLARKSENGVSGEGGQVRVASRAGCVLSCQVPPRRASPTRPSGRLPPSSALLHEGHAQQIFPKPIMISFLY